MRLKILILPVSLAVVVVMSVFYIKPYFSDMSSAKATLSQKQEQLAGLKQQNQRLQQIKSEWDALGEEKTLVQTALPEAVDIDSYISEITSKASRSGVLLSGIRINPQGSSEDGYSYVCEEVVPEALAPSVSPKAVVPAETVPVEPISAGCLEMVAVNMTAQGSWEQILEFFKYLEDMNRVSNVKGATITTQAPSQDQAPSDLLNVTVSAGTFFKKRSQAGSLALVNDLISQNGFNKKALEKLRGIVYSLYDVPAVSPAGGRNIFK